MFEAKTNGAKWREAIEKVVGGAVDAAAPQAMPTQPRAGQRPIAELVIEDIRARAEAGERKYGTKLHAHNGRRALMDLYQEMLDATQYTRQALEEDYEGRALRAEATLGEVRKAFGCGEEVDPATVALGFDRWRTRALGAEAALAEARRSHAAAEGARDRAAVEKVGLDWAAAVKRAETSRDDAHAVARQWETEAEKLRKDIADERDAAIEAEARAGQAALDLVADRMGRAADAESLKAGLRALAIARDEGAVETHRWRDRALCAEAKVVAMKEEHAAVESWGNEGAREMKAEIDRLRALLSKAESDRAESDELFARIVVLVDRVSALRAAVRAARVRAQQAEAKLDGALRRAEGGADVAARLRAIIDPEGHWNIDGLLGRVRALQEQAAGGESTEALLARTELDAAWAVVGAHQRIVRGMGVGLAEVILERSKTQRETELALAVARSDLDFIRTKQAIRRRRDERAWTPRLANELRAGAPDACPIAPPETPTIERLRALLDPEAGLVRLDDDGLVERVRELLDVEDAAGQDRRSADMAIANAQRERDGYKRQVDCASPEGCGECLACVGRYLDDAVKAEAEARRVVQELRGEAREVAERQVAAEVAHLKAKRATSDEERDQARAKLGRVVALCQAELEHEPSLLSTATRSLAWVLLREVAPELADRVGTPAPAPAAKPVDGYPPSGAPDPEPVAEDVGGPEVAPAAPVEAPQAAETQPDPGEGWRLLGPEEVIETGDQWWGGAMVGPVWLVASATIGETPAAINAHPRATERRVFRRLIAAPITQAPAVEPVTEVAIEARGSKFVIVRRAVAP